MATKEEIYSEVVSAVAQLFDQPAQSLSPDTRLIEDLDLDSIDAIEMAVRLEERIGYEFKGPELRGVRTLRDIVNLVHAKQAVGSPAADAMAARQE